MVRKEKEQIRTVSVRIPARIMKRADSCVNSGLFGSRNDLILKYCRNLFYEVRDIIDENDGLIGPTKYKQLARIAFDIKYTSGKMTLFKDEEEKQIIFRISQPFASEFESVMKILNINWSEVVRIALFSGESSIRIDLNKLDADVLHDQIEKYALSRHYNDPIPDDYEILE